MGWRRVALIVVVLLALSGCGGRWETALVDAQGETVTVTRETLEALETFANEDEKLPVERVLYENGYRLVETLEVVTPDGATRRFDWAGVAETAWWGRDGALHLGDDVVKATQVRPVAPLPSVQPVTGLWDIAPTVSALLGLPAPADATGQALPAVAEGWAPKHVVLIFLDGFGYVRYMEALAEELIPNLAALDTPLPGWAAYPPCTAVGSAAILTGARPDVSGVVMRGIRSTGSETLFDVVAAAGLRGVAVEGDALAFNMRSVEVTLSGDRDGNGGTDDNVLANALAVLEKGTPDVLWVHFHGIDDAGHGYGPGSPEEQAKVREVDAAVGTLLAALPPDTAVLIFADHGMHRVAEEGRLGNHGNLIARDMLVPVWLFEN